MMSPVPSARRLSAVVLAALLAACASKSERAREPHTLDAAPPAIESESAAPAAPAEPVQHDELAALEQQLGARKAQLQAAGVVAQTPKEAKDDEQRLKKSTAASGPAPKSPTKPSPTAPSTAPAADAASAEKQESPAERCTQVCEISAAICDLRDQICDLLTRHLDEKRYILACDAAIADCRISTEACHGCTDN